MDDHPVDAVRAKPDSSLVRAVRAVADGDADAVVSAGNTGAMLAASLLHIRRLQGVHRRASRSSSRRSVAGVSDRRGRERGRPTRAARPVRPHGRVFAEEILEVSDPELRLLSIGEEPEKGNQLTLEAHELLRSAGLRFGGNTEGRTLLEGDADVIVADGFTGNVALKTLEGTVKSLLDALRSELEASARGGSAERSFGRLLGASRSPRSGDIRRRLSPRAERPRRDRTRLELAHRDRKCDPARRSRGRASRRRTTQRAHGAGRVRVGALHDPDGREVRFQAWRLRVRRSSSRSKAR